jgi:predicted pyridoxine 5'-phosphate oxidase superfamily flavin-nucleotide-binding protein
MTLQPFVVISSVDTEGDVWASLLSGDAGFMSAIDDRTVRIGALPIDGDPLKENLKTNHQVGMIVIEFSTRRRMRINGRADLGDDLAIYVRTDQVYANCPKYIHPRSWEPRSKKDQQIDVSRGEFITDQQRKLIESANTFFIASHHPEGGADASHRGGDPGFVRVLDQRTLIFPDYSGNMMFQTLGNLTENPACGLLFIDFEKDITVQLSGTAEIIWEPDRVAQFDGAQRIISVTIAKVVEIFR